MTDDTAATGGAARGNGAPPAAPARDTPGGPAPARGGAAGDPALAGDGPPRPAAPDTVRRLDLSEAGELAELAAVFEDLQYALRCCEHLVTALGGPASGLPPAEPDAALVEALWTGALLAYARGFSARAKLLTEADLGELGLDGDVRGFHQMVLKLRDHYASRHVNPREAFTIGVAQANDGHPTGIAVVSTPRPLVDDTTVRLLGRVAYALSGLVDARMAQAQGRVLGAAAALSPAMLSGLPLVHLQPAG